MAETSVDRLPEVPYRPSIFIASSGKSKPVADAVASYFAKKNYSTYVWYQGVFGLNESTINTLIHRASYDDFFIAVFAADDDALIKDELKKVTRANVVFEFGLFLGCIGMRRTFFLLEEGADLFSDWEGITVTRYTKTDDLAASVAGSCADIASKLEAAGRRYSFSLLPSTSLAIGYFHNFLKPVLDALSTEKSFDIVRKDKHGEIIERFTQTIENHSPTIEIRAPRNLASLERTRLRTHTEGFVQLVLKTSIREFPFYVQGNFGVDNDLQLFDIPTTLYASYKTIDEFFSDAFLADKGNLERLMNREIRNFEDTLSKLIPDEQEHKFYKFTIY